MIGIYLTGEDARQFMGLVSRIINGAARCYKPAEIYLIQVDSWFDHKWKAFSGVIDLQFGTWAGPLLRVPPFNPHRIVSELHYQLNEQSKSGYVQTPAPYLHVFQYSGSNLQRRLTQMSESSLYIWYSCNTKKNDRGSLMLYNIEKDKQVAWYVSFARNDEWRVHKLKGISRAELSGLMEMSGDSEGV